MPGLSFVVCFDVCTWCVPGCCWEWVKSAMAALSQSPELCPVGCLQEVEIQSGSTPLFGSCFAVVGGQAMHGEMLSKSLDTGNCPASLTVPRGVCVCWGSWVVSLASATSTWAFPHPSVSCAVHMCPACLNTPVECVSLPSASCLSVTSCDSALCSEPPKQRVCTWL